MLDTTTNKIILNQSLVELGHVNDGQEIVDGQWQQQDPFLERAEAANIGKNIVEIIDGHLLLFIEYKKKTH